MQRLGAPRPTLTFYLPTPPGSPDFQPAPPDVPALIAANGNHWRKIVTIAAKIACPTGDWRHYRDHCLLGRHEQLEFGPCLQDHPGWHLVCGQANWQRLGLVPDDFTPLDDAGRCRVRQRLVLTPYPDYRQFPNALIATLCHYMRRHDNEHRP